MSVGNVLWLRVHDSVPNCDQVCSSLWCEMEENAYQRKFSDYFLIFYIFPV